MKKIFTILTAMLLFASMSFAQVDNSRKVPMKQAKTAMQKAEKVMMGNASKTASPFKANKPSRKLKSPVHNRISGNPVWQNTMSYCLDGAFASNIGIGQTGTNVSWGIKIESAALVGRNNITNVQIFIVDPGTYTMNIYQDNVGGTAIATQSFTATIADTMAWKTLTFATPVAINQSQDLWVIFNNSDVAYPAAGVVGTVYDNGKYISLDGIEFDLISAYDLDYTWMIKVTTDTYTELAPIVSINGPMSVRTLDTVSFTAASSNADSYAWTINADYQSTSANVANVMWSTTGTKQIVVAATNSVGTSYDTMEVDVYSCENLTIPYTPSFTDGLGCWDNHQLLEEDMGWFTCSEVGLEEGQLASLSAELIWGMFVMDVDVDNWVISPNIAMPTTGNYEIAWKVKPFDIDYPGDHYGVYVISGTDTTLLYEETLNADMEDFVQRTAVIPSTLTGDFKFAFRHFNSNGGYAILLDNIQLRNLTAPEVTITGPAYAENSVPVTFKAISGNATDFAWTVDGTALNTNSNEITHTFTEDGNHTVAVTASNAVGADSTEVTVTVYTCNPVTTFPLFQDFEDNINCWTMISNDPANDEEFGLYEDAYAYDGNYDFRFSSYNRAEGEEEDYNQYLITPELQLPDTGIYMVKFYRQADDEDDAFRVLTSSTTKDISSFTELADYPTVSEDWEEVVLILPEGTKYVAINYYGDYAYHLYIDNFSIESLTAPSVVISGPESIGLDMEAVFTAISPLAESFAWNVDGTDVNTNSYTLSHIFTTTGSHTVTVTATNVMGSNTASMIVSVYPCGTITSLPYFQDFENVEAFDCWNFIDADRDGYTWDLTFLRDEVNEETNEGEGHNGSLGFVASASYINNIGALTPDNWMISPAITIPEGAYHLNWFAKGLDSSYCAEHYSVYVSTTASVNAFLETTPLYSGDATYNWASHSVNLSDYAGQTIHFAFRHHDATDMYWLLIDDLSIKEGTGIENHDNSISVYPNPATNMVNVMGEGIQKVQVLDMNGRVLMNEDGGQINISKLATGMYLLRVVTEDGIHMEKLIKR